MKKFGQVYPNWQIITHTFHVNNTNLYRYFLYIYTHFFSIAWKKADLREVFAKRYPKTYIDLPDTAYDLLHVKYSN